MFVMIVGEVTRIGSDVRLYSMKLANTITANAL
jgi:hypothetical protein